MALLIVHDIQTESSSLVPFVKGLNPRLVANWYSLFHTKLHGLSTRNANHSNSFDEKSGEYVLY